MSEDERDAIIGRTVRQHNEAVRDLAALYAESEHIGNFLTTLGHALRTSHSLYAGSFGSSSGTVDLDKLPTRERLEQLVADLKTAHANRDRLADILRSAGFEPPKGSHRQ
jgi:hypothetical protein